MNPEAAAKHQRVLARRRQRYQEVKLQRTAQAQPAASQTTNRQAVPPVQAQVGTAPGFLPLILRQASPQSQPIGVSRTAATIPSERTIVLPWVQPASTDLQVQGNQLLPDNDEPMPDNANALHEENEQSYQPLRSNANLQLEPIPDAIDDEAEEQNAMADADESEANDAQYFMHQIDDAMPSFDISSPESSEHSALAQSPTAVNDAPARRVECSSSSESDEFLSPLPPRRRIRPVHVSDDGITPELP
jgi:hypothetical protein